MVQKIREQLYDPKATTDDFRYEEDPNRNLQSEYGSAAVVGALTSAKTVDDGYTLLIHHIDFEADGNAVVSLEKSTDGGTNWTTVRKWRLKTTAAGGHFSRDYEKAPFSFEGKPTGQTPDIAVQVRLKLETVIATTGGWNGKYIKT